MVKKMNINIFNSLYHYSSVVHTQGKTHLELAETFASLFHSTNYYKKIIVLLLSDTVNSCF